MGWLNAGLKFCTNLLIEYKSFKVSRDVHCLSADVANLILVRLGDVNDIQNSYTKSELDRNFSEAFNMKKCT